MYTVHQAKTNLSRLIEQAENGDEVVIARGKKPVAKLVALAGRKRRIGGSLRGKISVPKTFFRPLSAAELKRWGL
jgi:antitoxin (DNA-binding transcriptional repressor) of toxin-antitoxin stability system